MWLSVSNQEIEKHLMWDNYWIMMNACFTGNREKRYFIKQVVTNISAVPYIFLNECSTLYMVES